jgi:hypothetical protein
LDEVLVLIVAVHPDAVTRVRILVQARVCAWASKAVRHRSTSESPSGVSSTRQCSRSRTFRWPVLICSNTLASLRRNANPPQELSLAKLHYFIFTGRLDATQPITMKELKDSGCVSGIKQGGVKLLGDVCPTPFFSTNAPMLYR